MFTNILLFIVLKMMLMNAFVFALRFVKLYLVYTFGVSNFI